jgi:biotin carboxyl carrier protein
MVSSTAANTSPSQAATAAPSSLQFKPEDAFNIEISALDSASSTTAYTVQLDTIQTNNFPDELVAHAQSTIPAFPSHFAMTLKKKSALGSGLRRKASPQSVGEIASPVTGMLVELSVQEGDVVVIGQELFVMSAMKMETVVKSSINGRVQSVYAKPNELVEIGDLVVELSEKKDSKI